MSEIMTTAPMGSPPGHVCYRGCGENIGHHEAQDGHNHAKHLNDDLGNSEANSLVDKAGRAYKGPSPGVK